MLLLIDWFPKDIMYKDLSLQTFICGAQHAHA
jgi:hypothetical protein